MIWNHDISAAPRGRTETKERTIGNNVQQYDVFVPERVLIVDENMKVYASYWLPQQRSHSGAPKGGNRWSGWSEGQEPIAWAPWPEYKRTSMTVNVEAFKKLFEEGKVFADTDPEARFIADSENSCPHCGGSGHKDDVVGAE